MRWSGEGLEEVWRRPRSSATARPLPECGPEAGAQREVPGLGPRLGLFILFWFLLVEWLSGDHPLGIAGEFKARLHYVKVSSCSGGYVSDSVVGCVCSACSGWIL